MSRGRPSHQATQEDRGCSSDPGSRKAGPLGALSGLQGLQLGQGMARRSSSPGLEYEGSMLGSIPRVTQAPLHPGRTCQAAVWRACGRAIWGLSRSRDDQTYGRQELRLHARGSSGIPGSLASLRASGEKFRQPPWRGVDGQGSPASGCPRGRGERVGPGAVAIQSLSHVRLFVTPWTAARLPCPSPSPRVCSNSCLLS